MDDESATDLPRPAWGLEEAQTLARVRDRMFGASLEPLRLSRYHILRPVAAGGFGAVYQGYDPELDRKVAIKLLRTESRDAEEAVNRLLREARALARLTHPAVLPVYDVGRLRASGGAIPDGLFMVTELVDGMTLREWLDQRRRPWRDVLRVFATAGEGLAAAHDAGIIHRDFKPANVLIGSDGRIRVADFGLARWSSAQDSDTDSPPESTVSGPHVEITQPGTVMGTPRYMAPEQHNGDPVDARTDQYAFCVALYEALYGEPPFGGSFLDALAIGKAKGLGARSPPRSRVPLRLYRLLRRGLSPRPEDRLESMAALLQSLAAIERLRRRSLGGLAGLALTGAAAFTLMPSRASTAHGLCSDVDSLDAQWSFEARTAVLERLTTQVDAPIAREIAESLDAYVDRWNASRTQTCHAVVGTDPHAVEAIRRRLACFESRRTELESIVQILASADRKTARHGERIVEMLPDPSTCTNDEELAAHFLPVEPEQAQAVTHAQAHMLSLRALRLSGRHQEARAEGLEALRFAEKADHPPTRARALFALAWVETALLELEDAEQHVRAGWAVTEANGLAEPSLRAVIDLADNLRVQERHDEAQHMLDLAEAKASFLQEGVGLQSDLSFQRAALLADLGRTEEAIPYFERALEMRVEIFGPGHLAVARTRVHFARALASHGELVRARSQLERVERALAASSGAPPAAIASLHAEAARLEHASGRHEEALDALQAACEELRAAGPPHRLDHVRCLLYVGEAASALGRSQEAMTAHETARSIALQVLAPGRPTVVATQKGLAAKTP